MPRILVAFFSASGNTARLAKMLADAISADIFEIVPEKRYSEADLNWQDGSSRSSVEMRDRNARPAISSRADAVIEKSDFIFIGFPIWWYRQPSIIDTFVESYDFSGKTIIPFATSGGSGIGECSANMRKLAKGINVLEGRRFSSMAAPDELKKWALTVIGAKA